MSKQTLPNKENLTWEILEDEIRETFVDEDSELVSQMMDDLKKKYILPCDCKTNDDSDKKFGYYGC